MDVKNIQNDELRRFIENNENADLYQIVEFCREKISEALLNSVLANKLNLEFENMYIAKVKNEIEPYEERTENRIYYNKLVDYADEEFENYMKQLEELNYDHGDNFAAKLQSVIDRELDEIFSGNLDFINNTTEVNAVKEEQDEDDKNYMNNLDEDFSQTKSYILKNFESLIQEDLENYGANDARHIGGAQDKVDDLTRILAESDEFFKDIIGDVLNQNNRIFEDFEIVRAECVEIIKEAIRMRDENSLENAQEGKDAFEDSLKSNIFFKDVEKASGEIVKSKENEKTKDDNVPLFDLDNIY